MIIDCNRAAICLLHKLSRVGVLKGEGGLEWAGWVPLEFFY